MYRKIITFVLAATALAFCATVSAQAAPAAACNVIAAPNGVSGAAGTLQNPLRTVQDVITKLSSGQTGCLAGGTYEVGNYKIEKAGITLTSLDGADATVRGRLWIAGDSVTLEELTLNNKTQSLLPSTITGDEVVLRDNEITNDNSTICFTLGSAGWGRAYRTLVEGNRIHHCGHLPATNYDHGIYVEASTDAVIRNNWIYQNADRGIQLYPDAQGTLIEGNVIDRNGEGIIFGGDASSASSDTIIHNNLITNSRLRDNVESYYDAGEPVGRSNLVTNNCISGGAYDDGDGGILQNAKGFDARSNLLVDPGYMNPAAGDYNLRPDSPCAALLEGKEIETKVSLRSSKRRVHKGRKLRLKGKVLGAGWVTVKVQGRDSWRKVDGAKVRNGKFVAKVRPRHPGKTHFKAVAKDAESGAVKVQVRGRGHGH